MPQRHQNFLLPPHIPFLKNLCIVQGGCSPHSIHISQLNQRWLPWPRAIGLPEQWDPLSQEFRIGHRKTGLDIVVARLLTGMFCPCRRIVFTESWKLKSLNGKRKVSELLLVRSLHLFSDPITWISLYYVRYSSKLPVKCFFLHAPFWFLLYITRWSLMNFPTLLFQSLWYKFLPQLGLLLSILSFQLYVTISGSPQNVMFFVP